MFEFLPPRVRLRGKPRLLAHETRQLTHDFERFATGLPRPLESYVYETFGIDLASVYANLRVKNPFGKASGQLSLARHQVEKDAAAGLGFVVLKTVIAQDISGQQSMHEWAIPETHMLAERIEGRGGKTGWTVTWKGRGWFDTFDAYLQLFAGSLETASKTRMLVVPSVKYHLPTPGENFWKQEEYTFTTRALLEVWESRCRELMPVEKDFSPTLAGSERAMQEAKILEWLHTVPGLIHSAAPGRISVGLKIFNAMFEDQFQLRMFETVSGAPPGEGRADFLVYANRLFDPGKEFEGKKGVAYGGPDLSDRNLAVLERWLSPCRSSDPDKHTPGADDAAGRDPLPFSATGDIHSGRIAAEYLLRGASSFQMHTLFQLPDSEFAMKSGSRTERALHSLLFHPQEGFIAWILDLRRRVGLKSKHNVSDMAAWCLQQWTTIAESLSGPLSGSAVP